MSAPLLKVCGLRDAATAASAAPLAIDYIGFMFVATSKRRVTAEDARVMIEAMRAAGGRQKFVGVFVDPTIEELEALLADSPLDVLQLHGAESPAFVRECRSRFPGVAVWKVMGIAGEAEHGDDAVEARLAPYGDLLDALLLDTFDPVVGGGTGRTFRWDVIPAYRRWTQAQGIPLFAAGGLHEGNVGELLAAGIVDGVDVSSGVETDGAKDLDKIRTFVKRVKP
ncbi:phosphoribosylanthranilate isomerase [Paenibacillus antri]|uniref:N-(5'-phosphoribosyl)anthranilate isomerase n=1 Tax=Paenibacillus antri TaxID=2582848 RepID=A0A5R9GME1_9BACL|nr:phosphoribosylanthranilate isomerase [Paenibacillus antri]TLS53105.1 phosphoribosylanthranilate isomerase [Paenibacillus antri]